MSRIWIWLWEVASCEGGDIAAIVAKAKAHKVGVMVKTHDGATSAPNGYLGFRLVEELQKAGVPVRCWGYCYPGVSADLQGDFAAQAGVDYIADVEVEWDMMRPEAARFVDALRSKLAGRLIGYAPLPIVSYHDGGGQYEEFNRLDVACPQAYAGTGGRDAMGALHWTQEEWELAFAHCNVEPAVYAADQPADGLRSAIAYVSGTARSFGNGDVSVWSWQHMTPEHWAVIDEFTQEEAVNKAELVDALNDDENVVKKVFTFTALKEAIWALGAHMKEIAQPDPSTLAIAVTSRVEANLSRIFSGLVPPMPPGCPAGTRYFGESADGSVVGWTFPDGTTHYFKDAVDMTASS